MPRTSAIVNRHPRELSFAAYASFDALAADGAMLDALIEQYQRVFEASEVWGETYAREDVLARLRDELAGEASLRICHDRSGTVLGFCWAQLLDAAAVMRAVDTIKFYQSMALPDLPDRIDALLSGTPVLYVHDLGIARSARSRVPLTQLIYPVLADVARRTGHGRVLFWTMPETRVSTLARRARFVECPMPNGMRFHLGEFRAHHDGNVLGLRWMATEDTAAAVHADQDRRCGR